MSIQTQTALGILRHYGYACVPYGDRKILVREGKDFVVVPNDRVDQFLKRAEMSTKTEKLRAALVSRGFAPIDHVSQRECLKGPSVQGGDIWIWLDKVGGARYARTPRKGDAQALSTVTVGLVIAGKPSKLIPGGAA